MNNAELVRSLLDRAVEQVNGGISKTLTARRAIEAPPLDPRHLTDTRTRVSTLLEYSLAYEMNHLLADEGKGHSVSAVLWNVFPDLLLRDAARNPVVGMEVKALHTAAEEKSANLATPLHVIRKGSDFVVILIWAWHREGIGGVNITYPRIHLAEVFDAYLLAQMRDYSWLFNQGGRIKGIDIATPIITPKTRPKSDRFKAEEGNMGKLMRIELHAGMPGGTPNLPELEREAERYHRFKESVLGLGLTETFREVCELQQADHVECQAVRAYPANLSELGRAKLRSGFSFSLFAGGSIADLPRRKPDASRDPKGTVALWLSSKLRWGLFKATDSGWEQIDNGDKPDTAYEKIQRAMGS